MIIIIVPCRIFKLTTVRAFGYIISINMNIRPTHDLNSYTAQPTQTLFSILLMYYYIFTTAAAAAVSLFDVQVNASQSRWINHIYLSRSITSCMSFVVLFIR